MNPTQTARLSVIFISLFYFLPIITAFLMGHKIPFQELPALTYPLAIIVALFLLLPGIGAVLYLRAAKLKRKSILAAVAASVCGVLFLFFIFSYGFKPSGIESSIIIFLAFLYPVVQLFLIPVWFTISHAGEPRRIPQALSVLAPIFGLLFLYFFFQFPDCPVGEIYPAYSPLVIPFFFGAAVITSIILGITLLYRGITHPAIGNEF